jgi:DNA-binding transcriptional LysR family regulator
MLDVRRLRILREVAEAGSFSGAADSLHLTQSAVSQQIAALEREAGALLVDRNRGNLRLTDPGQALVCHADAVIARLDEAERELREIAGLRGGRLRMASFPTAGATVVISSVAAFRKGHPEIEIQLAEAEPETSIPQLRAGEHDLVIAYDFDGVPLPEERDLERELLLEEGMQLALPSGHPLAARRTARLADLAEETWVLGTCAATCRDNVKLACRNAGFEPRIGFESDDYQVHQSLAAAGLAVSLVPKLLLTGRHPGVALVDIEPDAPMRRVWAFTRPAETRSPAAAAMLEILRAECERFAAGR